MTDKIEFIDSSGNLFEDVGVEKQEARKLQFKSFLMVSLIKYIKDCGLLQTEAAIKLNTSPSRISNLMNHRIDLFSTEMLLDMMERVGFRVYETIKFDVNSFLKNELPKAKAHLGRK